MHHVNRIIIEWIRHSVLHAMHSMHIQRLNLSGHIVDAFLCNGSAQGIRYESLPINYIKNLLLSTERPYKIMFHKSSTNWSKFRWPFGMHRSLSLWLCATQHSEWLHLPTPHQRAHINCKEYYIYSKKKTGYWSKRLEIYLNLSHISVRVCLYYTILYNLPVVTHFDFAYDVSLSGRRLAVLPVFAQQGLRRPYGARWHACAFMYIDVANCYLSWRPCARASAPLNESESAREDCANCATSNCSVLSILRALKSLASIGALRSRLACTFRWPNGRL